MFVAVAICVLLMLPFVFVVDVGGCGGVDAIVCGSCRCWRCCAGSQLLLCVLLLMLVVVVD